MNWKSENLQLCIAIEGFLNTRYLNEPETVIYHGQDPVPNTVGRLTRFYLEMAAEMLYADVNGGLEEEYLDEYEKIKSIFPIYEGKIHTRHWDVEHYPFATLWFLLTDL